MRTFFVAISCLIIIVLGLKVGLSSSSRLCNVCEGNQMNNGELIEIDGNRRIPFSAVYGDGVMILYVNPSERGFCPCWVTDLGEQLQKEYPGKNIVTVLGVSDKEVASQLLLTYDGYLIGPIYMDTYGIVEKRYSPGIAAILFINEMGELNGLVPMENHLRDSRKFFAKLVAAIPGK